MESILTSVKKDLGIAEEYEVFDPDIIRNINSVFTVLTQLGVGPPEGFRISDKSSSWKEFVDDMRLEAVKTYMFLRVKLLFDPPLNSNVLASYKEQIKEFEWRLNLTAETSDSY